MLLKLLHNQGWGAKCEQHFRNDPGQNVSGNGLSFTLAERLASCDDNQKS